MLELQSAHKILLVFLGLLLFVGRIVHAYGVSQEDEDFRLRVTGMTMTFMSLIFSALANLGYFCAKMWG